MREQFPFLFFDENDDPIKMATDLHLRCERRGGSELTNPYSNLYNAFHITFYERIDRHDDLAELERCVGELKRRLAEKDPTDLTKKGLNIGKLYTKSGQVDRASEIPKFREASFTVWLLAFLVYARRIPNSKQMLATSDKVGSQESNWTMLILSPTQFFTNPHPNDKSFTNPHLNDKSIIDWASVAREKTPYSAEFATILYALNAVEVRWRSLNEYIGSLLTEDFMDPAAFTKLLFDDEDFSRSKLYFWAIGCLNEFEASIEDNILQLKLYRMARMAHLQGNQPEGGGTSSKSNTNSKSRSEELDSKADELLRSLEDLKSQFQSKKTTVEALRSGVSFSSQALFPPMPHLTLYSIAIQCQRAQGEQILD